MALAKDTLQRERDAFVEVGSQTTKAVTLYDASGSQISPADPVGIKNAAATTINPATEEKQDNIVTKLTTPTGINGAPVTIGTSEVEITFTGTTRVISLKAASTNTGLIWFGPSGVTNAGANAYGELTADSSVEIELNDASAAIYCISNTASQKVYKAALT